jgi:hypothetical protein
MKHFIVNSLILIALQFAVLTGCQGDFLSGSGAMRIDVDVYKGPLSQEPEIQWGELIGYLDEAQRTLIENANFTVAILANKGFPKFVRTDDRQPYFKAINVSELLRRPNEGTELPKRGRYIYLPLNDTQENLQSPIEWCDYVNPYGLLSQLDYVDCFILRGLYIDSLDLIQGLDFIVQRYSQYIHSGAEIPDEMARVILLKVAEISSELRAKVYRWAVSSTAGQSLDFKVRIAVVHFVMTASEYSNQLQARAGALMKQFFIKGKDTKELPLSTYLQGTEPTDFIHLYDWLDASINAAPFSSLLWLVPGRPQMGVEDRIKIVERLYSDHFWSKINTVYASGKGKVQLAFVKDEIGNWDLKNFANYPGELLQAYQDVASALLQSTLKLARDYSTAGSGRLIEEGLRLANVAVSGGPNTPTITRNTMAKLRALEFETGVTIMRHMGEMERKDHSLRDEVLKAQRAYALIPEDRKRESHEGTRLQHTIGALKRHREAVIQALEEILRTFRQQIDQAETLTTPSQLSISN